MTTQFLLVAIFFVLKKELKEKDKNCWFARKGEELLSLTRGADRGEDNVGLCFRTQLCGLQKSKRLKLTDTAD